MRHIWEKGKFGGGKFGRGKFEGMLEGYFPEELKRYVDERQETQSTRFTAQPTVPTESFHPWEGIQYNFQDNLFHSQASPLTIGLQSNFPFQTLNARESRRGQR